MKIRQKLTLGFLTVVLLVGAVGYICLYQLYRIAEPLNKDIPEAVKAINETSRLDGLAQFIRYYDEVLTQSARNYAFTRDKKWEQRYRDVEPKLDKIIKEAIWRGDEKDKEFFSSVDKANLALVEMEYESIELVHNGQIEKAIKILEGNEYWDQKKIHEQALRGYVHRKGVRYDEALAGSTDKTELANNQAQNLIRTSTLLVLGFVVFALTLSAGIGFLISYSISNPIAKLKAATAKIGAGQLDTQIEINSNDEIGQLAASFKKMAEDLKRTTTSIDNLNAVNQQLESEINERKRAEEALEKLNKDLESTIRELSKSNEELQDFAHIAAHDLKAPLRAMGTLADWLLTDYGDNFDEKGREKIKLLTARAKRMSRHIDSALQYAELGHAVQEKEKVNLNRLVKEVIGEIAPPENVEITVVCELPTITCERTYMMQVFGNLLDNALKYMDKPEGRIKVGCVEEDGFWKFSVSDNGPGIEQKYFGKVFKIFQTLLPRDEFEATGIGLAVTRKIVELYNGKIWVESNPGQGSTFFFTLPKQEMGVNDAKLKTDIACRG